MHLSGWCFDTRSPILKVDAVFPEPLTVVPLTSYGLPSPDVAAAVNPDARHNRFDECFIIPPHTVGHLFRLQFTLSDGTIVLGGSDIGDAAEGESQSRSNAIQPKDAQSRLDCDRFGAASDSTSIPAELEMVKRRETEFRANIVHEFLDRGERNSYLHTLRQERAALIKRGQEVSLDLEAMVRRLEVEGERAAALETELHRIRSSTSWGKLRPIWALWRTFSRSHIPSTIVPSLKRAPADGSVFTYFLHTSPFRIYREHFFTLRGWAWPDDGRSITAIGANIDGSLFVGHHGLEEPEVIARYGNQTANPRPGFEITFETSQGRHQLSLEAELDHAEWRSIMKTSIWCEPTMP